MNSERFALLKELFLRAADLSENDRRVFLDEACEGDPELRGEVEALLAHDRDPDAILDRDALLRRALETVNERGRLVGETISHYEIVGLLGTGGMGEVYRARDTRLGRYVALKMMVPEISGDRDRLRRFEQEARAASALNHPNIMAIYDIGVHENTPFMVMELLEGETLRQTLNRGSIPLRKAIDCAVQCARGLAVAHDKRIIHRDIKPENLFVTNDGRVKILDFGVAKLMRSAPAAKSEGAGSGDSLTGSGAIIGTSGYMSPEQAQGRPADTRSDIFALGATLYEMLTGHRTFRKDSFIETLHAIVSEDPPPISGSGREVPAGLEAIVRRCLEKNPEERFQSARDLAFALEVLAGSRDRTAAPLAATKGASTRARLGLMTAAGFLLGALLIAAIGLMITRRDRGSDASRLKFTRLTAQRGSIHGARFSPDGNTVFYTALWNGRPLETFETRPGYPTCRSLGLPETSLLSVSRDGRMLVKIGAQSSNDFWGWRTLAEVPISGGTPRTILDDVQSADWSPDGRTLAVSRRTGGEVTLEMPPGHVLYKTAGNLLDVRISPDGAYLAFTEHPVFGDMRGAVVILDTAGRTAARSTEWNLCLGIDWSADGREVWYCPSQDLASSDLRAIGTRGKERLLARFGGGWTLRDVGQNGQVLLAQTSTCMSIRGHRSEHDAERDLGWFDLSRGGDISTDGRVLLFDEEGIYGGQLYAVCMRGMDGSTPVRLGEGWACALSPDGKWALAIQFGPPQRLVLLPTGTGAMRSVPRGTIERYYEASWMPDGKRVIFAGSEPAWAQRSYIQDLEGGPPRPITPEGIAGSRVSPDGTLLAALSGDRRLFLCPTGGGVARFVTQLLPQEEVIQWSTDGRAIYVATYGNSASVTRINLANGNRAFWRKFSVPDSAGVSAVRVVLTPDGKGYAFTYVRELVDLYLVDGLK